MIDIAIQTADVGALNLLLTDDPSLATPGLVQLASQPPVAGPDTLRRMADLLLHAGADPNHHEVLYHACEHPHHAILEPVLNSPRLEPRGSATASSTSSTTKTLKASNSCSKPVPTPISAPAPATVK